MKLLLILQIVWLPSFLLKAQVNTNILNTTIRVTSENTTVKNILEEITRNYHIVFSYEPSEIPLTREVKIARKEMPLKELLDAMFKNTDIGYSTR
jgi:uncharacterized protein (UPF0248 family)